MQIRKPSAAEMTANLASAAAAQRAATQEYRQALIAGDLPAAIRAKGSQLEAEVRLQRARWMIEGGDIA